MCIRDSDKGRLSNVRIAMGAVADRPVRIHEVEACLEGAQATETLAQKASDLLAKCIEPIDDLRSRRFYRLGVAANLVKRFVLEFGEASARG